MKNIRIALTVACLATSVSLFCAGAQQDNELKYRRSSMYSILVSHPYQDMNDEIVNAFMDLETPDKYNNHDLSVKVLSSRYSNREEVRGQVDNFLKVNNVAKRMVSKWFSRDKETGLFNPSLVLERGLYDAMAEDISLAEHSVRGVGALADRGYELIENSFVVVNDVHYIDHKANADIAAGIILLLGEVMNTATNSDNFTALANLGAGISLMVAGFQVNITSHLYQLEWNEEIENKFYTDYYYDTSVDEAKRQAFLSDTSTFKLKYIGSYKAKSNKPVLRGLYNDVDVFRKVLARAIDKNVVMLQKKYDQFKVKVPLNSVEPLTAQIGMKEGVTAKSKYEVLVPVFDESTGKYKYNRVGVIRPVPDKIWDNRYMAVEEQAVGSTLQATEFKVVKGSLSSFTEGMLIREIK